MLQAINFMAFDVYHQLFMRLSNKDGNMERFVAGACAGKRHVLSDCVIEKQVGTSLCMEGITLWQ